MPASHSGPPEEVPSTHASQAQLPPCGSAEALLLRAAAQRALSAMGVSFADLAAEVQADWLVRVWAEHGTRIQTACAGSTVL